MIQESLPLCRDAEFRRFQQENRATVGEVVQAIKRGIAAKEVEHLSSLLGLPLLELSIALGVPPTTIRRKARGGRVLRLDQGERVMGLQRIVGQVQTMVEDCGDPTNFDAGAWTGVWLKRAVPALGGKRPIEFLNTVAGLQLLSDLLQRNVTGAYA